MSRFVLLFAKLPLHYDINRNITYNFVTCLQLVATKQEGLPAKIKVSPLNYSTYDFGTKAE